MLPNRAVDGCDVVTSSPHSTAGLLPSLACESSAALVRCTRRAVECGDDVATSHHLPHSQTPVVVSPSTPTDGHLRAPVSGEATRTPSRAVATLATPDRALGGGNAAAAFTYPISAFRLVVEGPRHVDHHNKGIGPLGGPCSNRVPPAGTHLRGPNRQRPRLSVLVGPSKVVTVTTRIERNPACRECHRVRTRTKCGSTVHGKTQVPDVGTRMTGIA